MKTYIGFIAALLMVSQANAACIQQQAVRKNVKVVQQVQQYNAVVVPYQQYSQPFVWSVGASVAEEYRTSKEDQQAERISSKIMAKLEKRLAAYHASGGGQPAPPESPLGLTVLQRDCFKCHNPNSKAVIEKRSPKLFDDQGNLTVSQQEIGSILTVIRKGIMPPKPAEPLSDDDYLAVKVYLESGKPPIAAGNQQTKQQPPNSEPPGPSNP